MSSGTLTAGLAGSGSCAGAKAGAEVSTHRTTAQSSKWSVRIFSFYRCAARSAARDCHIWLNSPKKKQLCPGAARKGNQAMHSVIRDHGKAMKAETWEKFDEMNMRAEDGTRLPRACYRRWVPCGWLVAVEGEAVAFHLDVEHRWKASRRW
jgi:hypothetical protein